MELKNKLIIVTGGAGFIGSNIVDVLSKDNDVVVIDNMHTGTEENLRDAMKTGRVKVLHEHAGNIELIKERVKEKPDLLMHLGTYSSTPMYREDHHKVSRVVSDGISVFDYAVKNEIPVVFASSSSVYSELPQPHREDLPLKVTDFYTEAKIDVERLGELYSKLYGIDVTALRMFAVYGKHEEAKDGYANLVTQFLWWIKKGQSPVIYGDGTQQRDFTYVDDVVRAYLLAADKKGFNVYNVGTGKNYTLNELMEKLGQHLNRKITPTYVPIPMKNYVMYTLADTTKATKELGFTAKYTLDMGIDEMIKIYGPF